jgi:DNA-binding MarR family transcriptional regulator
MSKEFATPGRPHVRAELVELDGATRAFQRAVDEMDSAAVDYLGINRSDGNCLDVLQERGPMSAGELAAATGLSPGAITTLVDRLETDGYVRRTRDEDDRRRVVIELTELSHELVHELYGPLGAGYEWLSTLTDEQLALLVEFLQLGAKLNVENAARVRDLPRRDRTRRRGRPPRSTAG